MINNLKKLSKLLLISIILVSCQESTVDGLDESSQSKDALLKSSSNKKGFNISKESLKYDNAKDMMTGVNESLDENGFNFRLAKLEFMTNGKSGEAGRTILRDDNEVNLDTRWVPNDDRRLADGTNITYLIDDFWRLANGSIDAAPPIDSSFETWDSGTGCSDMPIIKRDYLAGTEPNYVLGLVFGFPADPFLADITTTGFLPGFVFNILDPEGSQFILGVTFTLIFVDDDGNATDIDNDGKDDTALKEVWYNDNFPWSTDGSAVDIETVALHENGHALELGHVGTIFRTEKNGKIHYSPRTVMNASYSGIQRKASGQANVAHCKNFKTWPE